MEHGLSMAVVVSVTVTLLAWTLVSQRLSRWNITAPMWFVAAGFLLAEGWSIVHIGLGSGGLRELAEVTLAVVLFGDAARVSVAALRRDPGLPGRLLLVGLPLTMVLGTVAAKALMPSLSWWVCAVIGASVAPTDAALGAAIMDDERVPARIRRVLNVESGLNDGIVTPFVKFFLVAAVVGTELETENEFRAVREMGIGVVIGVAIGLGGALLLHRARTADWSSPAYRAAAVAGLSLMSYAAALELSGNGFVAAFVGGLAYGAGTRRAGRAAGESEIEHSLEFTHQSAELLSLIVWFLFGALMVPVLSDLVWQDVAFAVLALTVVRMVPVALVLAGTGLDRATVAVVGWFGPRGLASVVFALLAVDGLTPDDGSQAVRVITATVLLSVVLHGVSAAPVSARFGASHHE
ncbi:MAG: hypothetical protein RL238_2219 [Actinomycetota bacterium]|jgi:NhaP-type Na+/H+ or K+/H+ antiporter